MKPKKSLGQHFLHNPTIIRNIVSAAGIEAGDTVVEIGPGTGALTDALLAAGARVIAIEKDHELAARLKEKYRGKNIEIIEDDVLHWDIENSFEIENLKFKIVGNIPYYLTGHLLRTLLQSWPSFRLAVLMVQREVAERMTAQPPDMNMLAVLVQCYTKPEIVAIVKRGNFTPAPKVDSAIVRLSPSQPPPYRKGEVKEGDSVLRLAARGFAHPRKKLGNNLPKEIIEKAGIDPSRRAETLTIAEWKSIAAAL